MIVSFLIPAYNASNTIGDTLSSIFRADMPADWSLDIVVVDDGSTDREALETHLDAYPQVQYIKHPVNRGKCAAVNTGIPHTQGEIVVLLDADDTVLPTWPASLNKIMTTWPETAPLCFSVCQTQDGLNTVAEPDYTGPLTFDDMLNERHTGEYLPLFRGTSLRASKGYRDPEGKLGCEMWTYLGLAKAHALWISAEVMRVYRVNHAGSVTSSLFEPHMANELVRCYDRVFDDFEQDYRTRAPRFLAKRKLRQAVFAVLALRRDKAWTTWKEAASWSTPLDSLFALATIVFGPKLVTPLVHTAKRLRLLKRFG